MKRAIIFANGRMEVPPTIIQRINHNDLVIAADGGTHHCKTLGLTPNIIIGDVDSLEPQEFINYQNAGIEIIKFPIHKDETDLELALHEALKREVTHVFIIGAFGNRWDMTIANVLLAAQAEFSEITIHLLDGSQELTILRGEGQIDISAPPGSILSLIPIAGDAQGVSTHGLEYSLNNETLYFGSSRGVSNVFINDLAKINIRKGILLICLMNSRIK